MDDYADLENFLSAYFHQDWQAEHDTPEAVAAYFAASESGEQVDAVRMQLAELLARNDDEAALAAAVRGFGGEYDYSADGKTCRAWLQDVMSILGNPTASPDA